MKVIDLDSKRSNANHIQKDMKYLEYVKTKQKQRAIEIERQLTKGYMKLLSNF